MTRWRLRNQVAPTAIVLLLAVLLLAPATLGGKVISAGDLQLFSPPFLTKPHGSAPENPLQFDSAFVFEPDGLLVREALREGRLPVWTDALSAGRPLLAAQQSAPLYPLTWIGVIFPYWESIAWILVLKVLLAALGAMLLARALGLGLAPSLLAGVSFGFGTYLIVWLLHPHSNVHVLLPWMFLLAEWVCRSGRPVDATLLGGVVGLAFLGGHPQSAFLASLATVAWVIYRLASLRATRRETLSRAVLTVGAGVLGLALAAVVLVPFAEALREGFDTSRSRPPLERRAALAVFFPEYWDRPDRPDAPAGPSNFTERTLYVGVLPLLLAVAGLFARRPRGPQLFFAGLGAAALAVALDTGPVTDAVSGLPALDAVNLTRLLVVASFALAMLAAIGAQLFLDGSPQERRRMLIAAAATAALPPLAVIVAHPSRLSETVAAAKRALGLDTPLTGEVVALASVLRWVGFALAALALLLALLRAPRRAGTIAALSLGVIAIDLLAMGWGYNPAIPKAEADPARPPAVRVMQDLTATGGRVVGIGGLEPNSASRWRLDDARGHEQPLVDRSTKLWYRLGGGSDGVTLAASPFDARTSKLLDLFGVQAVLLPPQAVRGSEFVFEETLGDGRVAYARRDAVVWARETELPPAYVAYRWRPSGSLGDALRLVSERSRGQALDEPVIETAEQPPAGPAPPPAAARVVSRSDTEVALEVVAKRPGRLVLLDTFYPGWKAEVDGGSVAIEPANAAFRSVPVGAGRHEVRFSYQPRTVIAGAVTSALAVVLILGGLALGTHSWRRRNRSRMMRVSVQPSETAVPAVPSDGSGRPGGGP